MKLVVFPRLFYWNGQFSSTKIADQVENGTQIHSFSLSKWQISTLIQYYNSVWAFIFIIFITGIHFADTHIAFTSFGRGKKSG